MRQTDRREWHPRAHILPHAPPTQHTDTRPPGGRAMLMVRPAPIIPTRSHDAQFTRAISCSWFIEDRHGDPVSRAARAGCNQSPPPAPALPEIATAGSSASPSRTGTNTPGAFRRWIASKCGLAPPDISMR